MTYGAAVPRFKPRPTLDNLREPLVPLGTRPSQSSSNAVHNSQELNLSPHTTINTPPTPTISNSNSFVRERSLSHSSSAHQQNNIYSDEFSNPSSTPFDDLTYSRDHSPSITLEPSSPLDTTSAASSYSRQQLTTSGKKLEKPKPKLYLHIGRIGRSKPNQPIEPARLRDVTEIRVANPTFTRENLRQRNYDAFFESGVPVYSLAKRPSPPRPSPEPEQLSTSSILIESADSEHRPHSLGLFHRPKHTVTFRSKSAEVVDTVNKVPSKGDRCPSQSFFVCV